MSNVIQKHLTLDEVIDYYDGPLIFSAHDTLGLRYVCTFLENDDKGTLYLCSPVSEKRLNEFTSGKIDLRSIFLQQESNELYTVHTVDPADGVLVGEQTQIDTIDSSLLPAAGYLVTNYVAEESLAIRHALVEVSLDVPEAAGETVIDTYTLSAALKTFQDFLKYAYKKAISVLNEEERKLIAAKDYYSTETFGFVPGSFTVKLRSRTTRDLMGFVELDRGLSKVMEIVSQAGNADNTIEVLKKNHGHLVSSYARFLDVLVDRGCSATLNWRPTSSNRKSERWTITTDEAIQIKSALARESDIQDEILEYIGVCTKIDSEGSVDRWAMETSDGNHYKGDVDSNVSIAGITVLTVSYKFTCKEVVYEDALGREKTKLLLVGYETV